MQLCITKGKFANLRQEVGLRPEASRRGVFDLVPRPSRFGLAWPFVCLTSSEWPAATRAKSHERQSGYEIKEF